MVADSGHTHNSTNRRKLVLLPHKPPTWAHGPLKDQKQCCAVAPLRKGASAMRCSGLPLGGGVRSGRGADAPLLLRRALPSIRSDPNSR